MKKSLLLNSIVLSVATLNPSALFAAPDPSRSAACAGAVAVAAACDTDNFRVFLGNILDTLMLLIGFLAVIVLVYGGIRYITSTGDSARIKAAKDTIIYGIIGLIVAIIARSIVDFVIANVKA